MSCLNPQKLTVFPDRTHTLTSGKDSRTVFGQWIDSVDDNGEMTQLFEVPCGKCSECLKDRKQRWTNRLLMESACYDPHQVYFITLTYDDSHLVYSSSGVPSLRKSHIQSFIKRLRDFLQRSDKPDVYHGPVATVRYFVSGEYGDRSLRPHYHCILFGVDILGYSPFTIVGHNEQGQVLYTSDLISYTWTYGNNTVARGDPSTFAYTCGYVNKKLDKVQLGYEQFGIEPEFSLMSRRPGIGQRWLLDHKDEIIANGTFVLPYSNGVVLRPDRYALRVIFDDPEIVARFKIRKRNMMLSNLSYQDSRRTMRSEDAFKLVAAAKAQRFTRSKKIF